MGRVRKYKKIKSCDPFYKGQKKADLKNDLPPSAKDFDQPLPKRFLRDMAIPTKKPTCSKADQVSFVNNKSGKCLPAKEKKMKRAGKRQRHEHEVEEEFVKQPKFKKKHGESEREFLSRVDQETNDRLAAAQRKQKTISEKRKKYYQVKKLKHQLRKQGVSLDDYEGVPQLDFNDLKDHVKFGEVAQAPPKLAPGKHRKGHSSHNKKVSELLLAAGGLKMGDEKKKEKEVVGLRHQQLVEEERVRVIAMYRDIKKSRHHQNDVRLK